MNLLVSITGLCFVAIGFIKRKEQLGCVVRCLDRMTAFIRNLSANAEFCLILLLCFAWSIGFEAWMTLTSERLQFADGKLVRQTVIELMLLSVVFWIGKVRGWSFNTFGTKISWKGTGAGVLLFVLTYIAQTIVYAAAYTLHPERIGFTSLPLALPIIFLISMVNPVFEEVLESGYFIHSLQRFGMWRAVLASALFRATLHTYQGLDGALSILAVGVIFGFTYWRWRQLWPLIVAHALLDFVAFLNLNHHVAYTR